MITIYYIIGQVNYQLFQVRKLYSKGLMNAQSGSLKYNTKLGLKNKSQYQVYQDDFNNYKSRSRSKLQLQQWNLIQSRLMSPNMHLNAEGQYNKSKDNERRSNGPKSSRVSSNQDKIQPTNGAVSYSDKIKIQFEVGESGSKTSEQLGKQIKSMREMLIQLNNLVTLKLNKYEMAQFVPKGMVASYQPEKQEELLLAKIQNNARIIESLQKQCKQIQQRDKELEQKDYLIQLQDSSNEILKGIREKRRLRHLEGVAVDKLDGKLLDMRQAAEDDQFRMVKVIKHNTLYYFKKFNEQKLVLETLEKNYQELQEKDQQITEKYNKYTKIAEQKNLLVKANRSYLENKKIQDQLNVKVDQAKKRVEVSKRSKQVQYQKVERQNEKIKKQINWVQSKLQQYQIRGQEVTNFTQSVIERNQIAPKLLNKISSKFTQILIRQSGGGSSTTPKDLSQFQSQNASKDNKILLNLKPKLNLSKKNSPRANERYQTLSLQKSERKINDKNQTIHFEQQKHKDYRIKPTMNIKKRSQNNSVILDSMKDNQINKSEDPSVLKRIYNFVTNKKADSH